MATSTQVLDIRIVNCGGMTDLMSEMEAGFLVSSLGLFRNVPVLGRATPRARITMMRAYNSTDFYRAAFCDADVLHIIGHGHGDELQVGYSKTRAKATSLLLQAKQKQATLPKVVISTACTLQNAYWQAGLKACGTEVFIASPDEPTPAALTAFDMSFYSAFLAQVRRGSDTQDRAREAFALADKHYRAIHATGTPFAKFTLSNL